jgi:hypothetical protein
MCCYWSTIYRLLDKDLREGDWGRHVLPMNPLDIQKRISVESEHSLGIFKIATTHIGGKCAL